MTPEQIKQVTKEATSAMNASKEYSNNEFVQKAFMAGITWQIGRELLSKEVPVYTEEELEDGDKGTN